MENRNVVLVGSAVVLTLIVVLTASLFWSLPVSRGVTADPTPSPLIRDRETTEEPLPALAPVSAAPPSPLRTSSRDEEEFAYTEFILREYDGIIGVFEAEADLPFMTIEVPVTSLRAADAASLRDGLSVRGSVELARLVEDLGS